MSASTVVIKRPSSSSQICNSNDQQGPYFAGLFAICIWGLAAIITSTNTEISPNATGISITITTQDCLIMLVTTWLLTKGLTENNHYYVLPWLLMSIWSMYNCHYASVFKMYKLLKRTNTVAVLPWLALTVDGLGLGKLTILLVIRSLLSVRVAQLAMNQWYHSKLEKELAVKS